MTTSTRRPRRVRTIVPRLMRERGISQYRLWKDLGCGINTARRLRQGIPPRSDDLMLRVARYFGVGIGDLFE